MATLKKNLDIIVVFQAANGAIELKWDMKKDTVWANLDQIANMFDRDKSVISRHIKNILKDEELIKDQTVAFFATVQKEGQKMVSRNIEHFNLDMIISIWYRVNSKVATNFRKRATKTLKDHITKGFTINPNRIQKNYDLFLRAVEDVKILNKSNIISSDDVLELIKVFGQTRFSLDAFDKWTLDHTKQTQKSVQLTAKEAYQDILKLKNELISKNEATELFAQEKNKGGLEGIFWNTPSLIFTNKIKIRNTLLFLEV